MSPEDEKKTEKQKDDAEKLADQLLADLLGDGAPKKTETQKLPSEEKSPAIAAPKPTPELAASKPTASLPEQKQKVAETPKPVETKTIETPKPTPKPVETKTIETPKPTPKPVETLVPEKEEEPEEPLHLGGGVEYNPHVRKPKPTPKPVETKPVAPVIPQPPGNPMKNIIVEKVVVNIGVGEAGDRIVKAERVLKMITGQNPVRTISKTTNKDLGIRAGQDIGCKVTLRGPSASDFLKKAFWVKENRIWVYSFDREGNFSFGISDYTDFKGMKYDPNIGVFGMDICTTLRRRAGKRIAQRRLMKRSMPRVHRISRKEGIEYAKMTFDLEVVE